jgi:hypothetical protein
MIPVCELVDAWLKQITEDEVTNYTSDFQLAIISQLQSCGYLKTAF